MESREVLKIGNWVKADIIGLGFYEVVSIDDFHINFKCLRIFDGKNPHYKNHITNCHRGVDENGVRIKIDHKKWFDRKVNRKSYD
jgi:hypothetical protein